MEQGGAGRWSDAELHGALARVFGYTAFRPHQIEIVKVLPKHQLDQYVKDHPVDLVISTEGQRVNTEIPVFRINGIANQQDYSR